MKKTMIKELKPSEQEILVEAWVEKIRNQKTMQFVILKDISGKIQLTIEKEKMLNIAKEFETLLPGSLVSVVGKIVDAPFVKIRGMELIPSKIEIASKAFIPSPIDDTSSPDLRCDFRWLDLRSEKNQLMLQVSSLIGRYFREFLIEKGFIEIHTPKIIGAASESGAEVFEIKYYDRKAYLAQSPQFYKQMAICSGLEKVFEVAPAFRAEKSYTSKHITEFISMDMEVAWLRKWEELADLEEELIVYMLTNIKEKLGEQIQSVFGVEVKIPKRPFPRMTLAELYKEFEKYGYIVPEHERGDMTTEAEKLCERVAKDKFNHEFIFATDFAAAGRAFYHRRKGLFSQGFDLIWKGVEITTGSERESDYEKLKAQSEERGLGKDIEFYLEFFKYGCPPHCGLALGLERMTMMLLGLPCLRESMFIVRTPSRITP